MSLHTTNRQPVIIPSPSHDLIEAVRTIDAVALAHEANDYVFSPLSFITSPLSQPSGVQAVAPLEVMANPSIPEHLRPPIYSSHSPMGRMMVVAVWAGIGSLAAMWVPLPGSWWCFITSMAAIVAMGVATIFCFRGWAATAAVGRFSILPVMNNATYLAWSLCAAVISFAASLDSRLDP